MTGPLASPDPTGDIAYTTGFDGLKKIELATSDTLTTAAGATVYFTWIEDAGAAGAGALIGYSGDEVADKPTSVDDDTNGSDGQ